MMMPKVTMKEIDFRSEHKRKGSDTIK